MEEGFFPLDRLADIEAHPEDFRLLERVPLTRLDVEERLPIKLHETMPGENVAQIVFMDTETTGIKFVEERLIQLGMVKCTFSMDRCILLSVDKVFRSFEDPKKPLSPEIIKITRITDDMVKGKRFDDEVVQAFVADKPLMVAHNAKFDRPFFDRRFPMLANLPWACTQSEIDWDALDVHSQKLEYILSTLGYFYSSHQADSDCMALAYAMYKKPEAFKMLIESSKRLSFRIDAVKSPFEKKDSIKALGFKFDKPKRCWSCVVEGKESLIQMLDKLEAIYTGAKSTAEVTQFSAFDRFKNAQN